MSFVCPLKLLIPGRDLKRTCNGLVTDLQHCPQTANTQHLSPITQNPDCKITKIFSLCQRLMKKNITFLGRSLCVILREKHVETQLLRLFYIDLTFFYVFNMVVPFFFRNFVRENINKYLNRLEVECGDFYNAIRIATEVNLSNCKKEKEKVNT